MLELDKGGDQDSCTLERVSCYYTRRRADQGVLRADIFISYLVTPILRIQRLEMILLPSGAN